MSSDLGQSATSVATVLCCPHCGSDRFTEMHDACLTIRVREENGDRIKSVVGIADYGSALYMMNCFSCGEPLEKSDLVVKS